MTPMSRSVDGIRVLALLALLASSVRAQEVRFVPGFNIGFEPGTAADVVTWQGESLVMLVSFDGGPLCWFAPFRSTDDAGVELEIVEWAVLGGCPGQTAFLHSRQDERAGHSSVYSYSDSALNNGLLTRHVPATKTVARHSLGEHANDLIIDFCVPWPCEFLCPGYITAVVARVRAIRW